ncbi:MAG: hypothetical protein EBR86_16310 [Planctomycetia bacterium]|nr:hypothetical protein [Planctomycetia bacterium]
MREISASVDGQDTLHNCEQRFNCYFDLGHLSQGHGIHGVIQQAMINFVVGHEVGHASVGDVGHGYGLYDQAKIVEPSAKFTKELQADLFGLCVVWDGLGSKRRAERYSIDMTAYGPVLFLAALFSLRYHFLEHESGLDWYERLCRLLKYIVWNLKSAVFPHETINQMSADLPETAAVTVASLAGVSSDDDWSELRAHYGELFREAIAGA